MTMPSLHFVLNSLGYDTSRRFTFRNANMQAGEGKDFAKHKMEISKDDVNYMRKTIRSLF
jgi:hypothetical protein